MKKFLSLIMVCILTFGLFSICAYADEVAPPDLSAITGAFQIRDSDGNSYKYYLKNGKILIEGSEISDEIRIKMNILFDGDYVYLYLPSLPIFHIKIDITELGYSGWEDIEITKSEYVKSYSETIGSTTYQVDEFIYEEEITKYYYLNDSFIFWETIYDDGSFSTTSLISSTVDDKTVEIPFYSIDVTFIFNWIFSHTLIVF